MIQQWKDFGHYLGDRPCITLHSVNGERCLAGRRGEIWENLGGKGYRAYEVLPSGNEKIYAIETIEEFTRALGRLDVPWGSKEQLYYANNYNKRHEWI